MMGNFHEAYSQVIKDELLAVNDLLLLSEKVKIALEKNEIRDLVEAIVIQNQLINVIADYEKKRIQYQIEKWGSEGETFKADLIIVKLTQQDCQDIVHDIVELKAALAKLRLEMEANQQLLTYANEYVGFMQKLLLPKRKNTYGKSGTFNQNSVPIVDKSV